VSAGGTDPPGGPPPGAVDEIEFVRAVEERFRALRERPLILSPEDLARVVAWHRRGLPLFLVIDTLEEVFREAVERRPPRRPRSLAYCEPAIEEAERAWREALVGRRDAPIAEVDGGTLAARARPTLAASAAPREVAEHVLAQLERDAGTGLPAERVAALQRELVDGCTATLTATERHELEAEVERLVAPYAGGMPAEVRERTRVALRDRLLRRRFRLPDLTLLALAEAPFPGPGGSPAAG
jgi:hypothetical protein